MSSGLPMIVNDIPTHLQYIENNKTGIVIGDKVSDFVDSVLLLKND